MQADRSDLTELLKNVPMQPPIDADTPVGSEASEYRSSTSSDEGKATKQSKGGKMFSRLVRISEEAEFFHDGSTGWARVPIEKHFEVYRVGSSQFERWLRRAYFLAFESVPQKEVLNSIIEHLEAQSQFGSSQRETYIRYAYHDGNIYLDLADSKWRAVKITKDGWQVQDKPDVMFRRSDKNQPLPAPEKGGSIDELKKFLNGGIPDSDFVLIKAWLVHCFMPSGSFVHLDLEGEQGAAKSTTTRVLKNLIDPGKGSLLPLPTKEQDLVIAASSSRVLGYDNLSGLNQIMSDALCRMSTGGGFASRKLYTDDEESIIEVQRPVIFNGIDSIATKPDLLDRSIIISLPEIPASERKDEATFWEEYNERRPYILGALLDAVSEALGRLKSVVVENPPRMVDFVRWVTAASGKLSLVTDNPGEDFISIYHRNRQDAIDIALESDILATAVLDLLKDKKTFYGTPSQLIKDLVLALGETPKGFPTERTIRKRLLRLKPALKQRGVTVTKSEKKVHGSKMIGLELKSDNSPQN